VKETSRQETPLAVVGREPEPRQDGEIRARWAWVEARVWTTRMLRALETGMEGGKCLFPRPRLALPESLPSGASSTSVRSTYQLESRMREIRLSGSGEGAVLSRPYLINERGGSSFTNWHSGNSGWCWFHQHRGKVFESEANNGEASPLTSAAIDRQE
jgi:hypothetical protein